MNQQLAYVVGVLRRLLTACPGRRSTSLGQAARGDELAVPSPTPEHHVREVADRLVAAVGWACPDCLPQSITVRLVGDERAVTVRHSSTCDAIGWWLAGPDPAQLGAPAGNPSNRFRAARLYDP